MSGLVIHHTCVNSKKIAHDFNLKVCFNGGKFALLMTFKSECWAYPVLEMRYQMFESSDVYIGRKPRTL